MPKYSTGEFGDFRIPQGLGKKIAVIGVVIACLIVVGGSTGITTVRLTTHGRAATDCSSISYDCFSLAAI